VAAFSLRLAGFVCPDRVIRIGQINDQRSVFRRKALGRPPLV
jgi:hypothetical protein